VPAIDRVTRERSGPALSGADSLGTALGEENARIDAKQVDAAVLGAAQLGASCHARWQAAERLRLRLSWAMY